MGFHKMRLAQALLANTWRIALFGLICSSAVAADWPQWRGIQRDAKSPEKNLLSSWPEDGPQMDWESSGFGAGYSSLAIVDGKIFTMGDVGDAQYVIAANQKDGKIIWKTKVGPPWEHEFIGARSTPTVDGDKVYALGTEGDLVCLRVKDGSEIWRKHLPDDFGADHMKYKNQTHWKFAESVLIDGEKLLATPGVRSAAILALNKNDGSELWRTEMPDIGEGGDDGAGYSSIVISHAAGIKQYVQLLGRGVIGVDAENGKFLWGYNRVANKVANIPTPLVEGDYVFTSTGYGTGSALLHIVKDGEGLKAEEVYFLDGKTAQNHHGGMILHKGHVYMGTGHNRGYPLCIKMETGEIAWGPAENEGRNSAAVAFADGNLYFRYQDGRMILIEATPEGYSEKGSFMIPDVKQFSWSHPVIVDGKLYLREQDKMYCYDIRSKS